MSTRTRLTQLGLETGKKARLHRILHKHGLRNGTALFLPYDQRVRARTARLLRQPRSERPGLHRPAGTRGATGLIFGRNIWQRDHDESLRFVERLRDILAKYDATAPLPG